MNHAIYNAIYCQPWNIEPSAWGSLHQSLQAGNFGDLSEFFNGRPETVIDENGIMHSHVQGVLGNHPPIAAKLGDTSYSDLHHDFDVAQEEQVRGIMLHIDSPGGQSAGNKEIAERVSRSDIPTASHATGMCCSAAYKIGVGARQFTADSSAMVGSVGTVLALLDESRAWEMAGIAPDFIKSGDLKTAGAPPSRTPEERAHLQQTVDDYAAQFKSHVTAHRRVSDEHMQGQAYVADRAAAANMIDRTIPLSDAYSSLLAKI